MSDGGISGTLHPLPDRHLADDGRHSVRRPGRLSAAAGRAAAAGRLPDHPDHRQLAGRQPRNHGLLGGAAAGAAVRADPRRRPDDLDELRSASTAVTIQFDLNRNIDGAANDVQARDQRRQRPIAEKPALAADLSQGQPGGLADPAAVGDLGHAAADRPSTTLSTPSSPSRSARFPASAQVIIGGQQKPSIRVQIDPAKLVAKGLSLEDVRNQIAITTVDSPKGNHRRRRPRAYTIYANDQLTGLQGLERRHHRLSQRRAAADPRHRPGRDRPGRRQAGGLGQRQARRVPGRLQAARRQRHRHRRPDQGAAAAAGGRDPAGDQDRTSSATAPRPSAPRSRTCSSRCC